MKNSSYFFKNNMKDTSQSQQCIIKGEVNIKLYCLKDKSLLRSFNEEEREIITSLKKSLINDIPLLGSYCKNKCTLLDVHFAKNLVEYKFSFQRESFKIENGRPIKIISHLLIQCKLYINKGIIAVTSCFEPEVSSVLKIVCNIHEYIKLKTNPRITLTYAPNNLKEVILDVKKVQLIHSFLKDRCVLTEVQVENENIPVFCMCDICDNSEIIGSLFKVNISKGKKKSITFYNKYDKNQKFIITEQGVVISTIPIENGAFDEIVKLIYIIINFKKAENSLVSIDSTIEDYCKFIHQNMTIEGVERQKKVIHRNLIELIKSNGKGTSLGVIYLTVVFNTLIKLCKSSEISEYFKVDIDILDYDELYSFLKLYVNKRCNLQVTKSHIEEAIYKISSIIRDTDNDEEKLLTYSQSLGI